MISGSQDGTIRIWDLTNGKEVKKIEVEGNVSSLAVTKDSTYMVAGIIRHLEDYHMYRTYVGFKNI